MRRVLMVWGVAVVICCGVGSTAAAQSEPPTARARSTPKVLAPPKGATANCIDGSYSTSTNQKTACSAHGGIHTWLRTGPAKVSGPRQKNERSRLTEDGSTPARADDNPAGLAPGSERKK